MLEHFVRCQRLVNSIPVRLKPFRVNVFTVFVRPGKFVTRVAHHSHEYSVTGAEIYKLRIAFEKKVMTALIRQLPFVFFFRQNFRPECRNWMPFYWQKFRQSTRYTYRFETVPERHTLEQGLKNTLRSDLKKAAEACHFFRDDDAWELVFELNRRSFERKNLRSPYSKAIFERLHRALQARAHAAVFIARDKAGGMPSAGVYLIFDEKEACLLLSGTSPAFKAQGAVYGLIREALLFAAERGLAFDFEGSMNEKIEHAFRSFGGCLTPYFRVGKERFF